jgi:nitrite reductase (NADH) small subunit
VVQALSRTESRDGWHRIGGVDEFPVGRFVTREVEEREIGVLRRSDETWVAVLNMCPHRYAPVCAGQVSGTILPAEGDELVYGLDEAVLRCPWHQWEFSLDTGWSLFGKTRMRLKLYPLALRGPDVLVRVP